MWKDLFKKASEKFELVAPLIDFCEAELLKQVEDGPNICVKQHF